MNPILFLDIDGVIHPFTRYSDYPFNPNLNKRLAIEKNNPAIEDFNPFLCHMIQYRFDWNAIQYIEQIIKEFDAKVVISSSWRLMYSDSDFEIMFSLMDWHHAYIGKTGKNKARYDLIKDYVKKNHVQAYLVIDDLDMTSYFHKHMILCHKAFSKENYEEARKSLQQQLFR